MGGIFGSLSKSDADQYYQPKGRYITQEELDQALKTWLTTYQPTIGPQNIDVDLLRQKLREQIQAKEYFRYRQYRSRMC
jgi:hypothetical protein